MKKGIAIILLLVLCFGLIGCGKQENPLPLVENPPQSEEFSYETNKDGYIISCELNIAGDSFAYTCEGDNYLLVEDDFSVISEFEPSETLWSGRAVKTTYFYAGTSKVFVIKYFGLDENMDAFCERIQIYNRSGEVVVDKTPREDVEEYYFGLGCDLLNPPLWTADGTPATDEEGNYLVDENAIGIDDHCFQRADNGVIVCGNLKSVTYYDTETGAVVYSQIYDPLTFGYVKSVFDRTDFHLAYKEILSVEALTKQWYNADGSYFEKVTDIYERELISEGNFNADGNPAS